MYGPPTPKLNKIRQEIDYNGTELHRIINKASFKKDFNLYTDHSLKRIPKGYEADHKNAEWLKLKSFIFMHSLTDAEIQERTFARKAVSKFKQLRPFVDFLNTALDD